MLGKEKVSTTGKSSDNCTDTACRGRRENPSCWERKAEESVQMISRTALSLLAISVKRRKLHAIYRSLSRYLADVNLSYPDVPL